MGENTGWIKLHRKIQDNEFWLSERFNKALAWIDLLLLANHKAATIFLRGIELHIERGQTCWSILSLSKRWKWNERTVVNFLNMLQKRGMIQYKTSNVSTIITISNYDSYQAYTEQNTQQNTEEIQSKIQTDNNGKNVNNEKNIILNNKEENSLNKYGKYS